MVFSSLTFFYFYLPTVLGVYYISPRKLKNFVLLVTGLIFYAWGEPRYVFVMIASAFIDYIAGRIIASSDENDFRRRTACLVISVCMNLALLGVFKYSSFIIGGINEIFGTVFIDPKLPLPIGISFYTFQSMSYTIDLYRGKIKVQKNIVDFMAYITMFPQIVAGPIVTYDKIEGQLKGRSIGLDRMSDGVCRFVNGLGKKVLLANNVGLLWEEVKAMNYSELSLVTAWLGIIAFAFQIYFDFSGYSDMAIGLGKMLGFDFPENFNYPYEAISITDFWRRWHITLSSWFRDYLYIPLGGNRKGTTRTAFNLLVTWSLTGLWHGASLNFILWGAYFGILIIIEKFITGKYIALIPKFPAKILTFVLVLFGWVLFETNTVTDSVDYFKAMLGLNGIIADSTSLYAVVNYGIILVVCAVGSTSFVKWAGKFFGKLKIDFTVVAKPFIILGIMLLSLAYLVSDGYNPFLYFRF